MSIPGERPSIGLKGQVIDIDSGNGRPLLGLAEQVVSEPETEVVNTRFQVFIERLEASDTGHLRRAYQLILRVAARADGKLPDKTATESNGPTSQHRPKKP